MEIIDVREVDHTNGNPRCWSPLRWMGGKTRAIPLIAPFIPNDVKKVVSPFLGGASLEVALACSGVTVSGYDIDGSLVTFWQQVLKNPQAVARFAERSLPADKGEFLRCKEVLKDGTTDHVKLASAFFVVNRTARGGNMYNGSFHRINDRFSPRNIKRLERFHCPRLRVKKGDFRKVLAKHPNDFLYLDPPYVKIGAIYTGHQDFPHQELCNALKKRDSWILSNNDCPEVRRMYAGFRMIPLEWSYSVSSKRDEGGKRSKELLILSHDLEIPRSFRRVRKS